MYASRAATCYNNVSHENRRNHRKQALEYSRQGGKSKVPQQGNKYIVETAKCAYRHGISNYTESRTIFPRRQCAIPNSHCVVAESSA